MTVARSVADVLDEHVVFEVESIDRMYLNVWQPRLAYGGGVQGFFVGHRGYHYASTALMDPMTKAFVADIHGFVAARGLDLVSFAKGQRKDDLAQEFLAKFTDEEGVLFVGRAQEKAGVWRTQRRYSPSTGGSYAWLVAPRRSSTSSTSTAWTPTSARSSSSSAPTSPTPPSCASTATTVATLMDQAGLSARAAADQLGHAKPSMTSDRYFGRGVTDTGAADVLEALA